MAFFSAMNLRDYQERASSCQRKAEAASSPAARETLLYLAARWRMLAEQEEGKLHQFTGPPAPPQILRGPDDDSA
jgi:hypothetical protein